MSNGMFDPTEQELAEERISNLLHTASYSHVWIPQEVKIAWTDVQEAKRVIAKLKSYPRMNTAMRNKADAAQIALTRGQTILTRFFATVQEGPQHIQLKELTWA